MHRSNKLVAQECVKDLAKFDMMYMKHSPAQHHRLLIQTLNADYEQSKEDWRRELKWQEAFTSDSSS